MTRYVRASIGVLLAVLTTTPIVLSADTVQLSLQDGRLTLVATNATPQQIFDAWSRAGGIQVVNAERMPAVPITIRLERIPEEQALETLLRPVTGYLARRRIDTSASTSIFDRIIILPTPASAQAPAAVAAAPPPPPPTAVNSPPVFAQPARPVSAPPSPPAAAAQQPSTAPAGIPQAPGVIRLVGPDGQPVEDDQAGAPPPYNPGDAPPAAPTGAARPGQALPMPTPQQAQPTPLNVPTGAPQPGMVVPAPQAQQPR